jgi:pimeloyl-ACP methyl ester carboxylesterase
MTRVTTKTRKTIKTTNHVRNDVRKAGVLALGACLAAALPQGACSGGHTAVRPAAPPRTTGNYRVPSGLDMHYEIEGAGRPLVLLHGAVANVEASFSRIRRALAPRFRTVGVEQQGHGGTPDIDRPLSYRQMAEDTVALLHHLGVDDADFFGWSDGGRVALEIAVRHPAMVRRLAVVGTSYTKRGEYDAVVDGDETASPESWPESVREIYARTALHPESFRTVAGKLGKLWAGFEGWRPDEIRSIAAPTLVMIGDGDSVRPEHAVEMFRLLPHGQLAILPLTDHFAPLQRADWIAGMLDTFFTSDPPRRGP